VTAIDFHPSDDKHFVSGSIDGKVRLWNVPEQRVVSWQDVHEMVTAVGYGRGGGRAVVGTMRGKCRFYGAGDKAGLEYEAQLGECCVCVCVCVPDEHDAGEREKWRRWCWRCVAHARPLR
jgi:hypothetical protein